MDLLDLPPELFQHIVYLYIMMHKVESTQKLLFLHSAFNGAISYSLIFELPREYYRYKLGHNFFKAQFSLILQARVRQVPRKNADALTAEKLNGVYPFLPKYITKVVNRVYEIAGLQYDHNDRKKHEANLCDAIVHYFKYAEGVSESGLYPLMLDESRANEQLKTEFNTTLPRATVAAAAAMYGSLDRIEAIVKQDDMWQASAAFGTPFNVAVSSGSAAIVLRALVAVQKMTPSPDSAVVDALLTGLGISLHRGHIGMASAILLVGSKQFPIIKAHTYKAWLDKAMAIGDLVTLNTILGLKHHARKQSLGDAFVKACKNGQHLILNVFFRNNLLNVTEYVNLSKATMSPPYCYPIMAAIRRAPSDEARAALVTELLQLRADPNGPSMAMGMPVSEIPLAMAAEKQSCATVKILFDNGADLMMPTARDSQWSAKFGVLQAIIALVRTSPYHEFCRKLEQELKLDGVLLITPLVMAVRNRCWGAVAILLNNGADLTTEIHHEDVAEEWFTVLDSIYDYFNTGRQHMLFRHVWLKLEAELASFDDVWLKLRAESDSDSGDDEEFPLERQPASTDEPCPVSYRSPVFYGTAGFPPPDASY
ncbi:uncharacterized protein N0V89_001284 [Didymosphaeria variabile]|uniref:Ankyrin n=1 Tax=Didymosphaeria variabile TaxID=1932322 RepID=A0A9W8XYE3_9PLEO|nr:uncharacterized protein N0V89_001284 [Didymosphaeria variabile]KAJ4360717.1 hypothetical protein N0V89_001284 [Didymosphaeria variabile]